MTMYSASRLLHRAASTQTSMLAVPVLRTIPRAFPVVRTTLFSSSSRSAFASSSRLLDAAAPPMSEGEKALKDKLEANLAGSKVEVQDVSGGCGTFYSISISHASFKGLSTIKQHRVVNELLKEEIKGMHGMQLKTTAD